MSPEQVAARAEAMKRIEQLDAVPTTAASVAEAPPEVDTPQTPPAAPELATHQMTPPSVRVPTTTPTPMAAAAEQLKAEAASHKQSSTPRVTVLTSKTLPPISKGNTPLADELSLVSRLSDYFFESKVSWYLKSAILGGVIVAVYVVLRIISALTR